jgi:hypothetical protein
LFVFLWLTGGTAPTLRAFLLLLGRSRICPTEARTSYAPFRYFAIVFAFDGLSTISNFIRIKLRRLEVHYSIHGVVI